MNIQRKPTLELWTDGACRGNGTDNSVGAYGVVMVYGEHKRELKQAEYNTTNNAQEIKAVIAALEAVKDFNAKIVVYSDSAYVINCFVKKWYVSWQNNNWLNSKREPVKNKYLWTRLIQLVNCCKDIEFVHVAGHKNIGYNNRADELANIAIEELIALQY